MRMNTRFFILVILSLIVISCKNGNGKKAEASTSIDVATEVVEPIIEVTTVNNIGYWTMPITNQISNRVTLKFDVAKGKYYTIEKMSNANKKDSLGVIVKRMSEGYHIEYIGAMKDNYSINGAKTVIWHCPGYDDVRCSANIDMNNFNETFLMYKPDKKVRWVATTSLSVEQAMNVFDWSKKYVRACVFEPESLVFPNIKDVKFYSRSDARYKIEYKVIGKDLYKKSISYPVSIIFESLDEPVFHTISLE